MSTTTTTVPVRAFRHLRDAFPDMTYAQRRLFELRTEFPLDVPTARKRGVWELDRRTSDGVEVRLLWTSVTGRAAGPA